MRILFLSPGLGIGGSERLILRYAEAMRDRGHHVGIAHGVERGVANDLVAVAREQGIEVFQVHDAPLTPRTTWAWARGLRRRGAAFAPDVLHAQSVTTALAARMAMARVPLVVTIHGLERAGSEPLAAPLLSALRARLTAVSEPAAETVSRHWPSPTVTVLPTGIDMDELERATRTADVDKFGAPAFCCVARQEPVKGVDVLVEAFARVLPELPGAGLTLVGSGSAAESNRLLADQLGIADAIRFAGSVPRAEPWVAQADITVLPSRREGLPVAALEALGLARPVVAADVGGTAAVVRDGETGWLVPPEDPPALARALVEAGSDLAEAARRGAAGRALLERDYPSAAVFDALEELFLTCAGKAGTAVPPLKPRPYYHGTRAFNAGRALVSKAGNGVPEWRGLRVLGYHRVTNDQDVLAVTPDQFREQLEAILACGAETVGLERGLDLLADGDEGRRLAITFDDGFRDTATEALPLLAEYGLTATVYLPTAVIDGKVGYGWYRGGQPPALSWPEIEELAEGGVLDFQAHSRTHPALPALEAADAQAEIARPRQEIERHTHRAVTSFCYPAGLYTAREAQLVVAAGYRSAVTTRAGVNTPHTPKAELRRTMVGWRDGPGLFAAKLAGGLDKPSAPSEWLQRRRARGS